MTTIRTTALALLAAMSVAFTGCSMIPGVPNITTNGSLAVTYDGKPLTLNVGKVICTFDGKGNVAFLSAEQSTGDTFGGTYSTKNEHAFILKTAQFELGLMAGNSDGDNDITKATVDKGVYTLEGQADDIGARAANSGTSNKKPVKVVVTCK